MEFKDKIICGDALAVLKTLPDNLVDCIITSPPYFGLRDYGCKEQIGLEETPELYIQKLVDLFHEARRVLKDEGTLWCNIGDSYWGGKGMSGSRDADYQGARNEEGKSMNTEHQQMGGKGKMRAQDAKHEIIKPKDLIGIPWMLAFALRADGWYLRQDIIWAKPNPMPESVTDRCTKAHEYIFLLSKSQRYYYDVDSIREPLSESTLNDIRIGCKTGRVGSKAHKLVLNGTHGKKGIGDPSKTRAELHNLNGRNKRSVWTVNTKPYSEAHFATFPEELIVDCIKAGCPADGLVLDPFMGAGTTGLVAKKLHRNYLGIELNPAYITIAENRISKEIGLFN
jgi:DNA modification methylase